jgi:hypothetical protein
VARRSTSLLDQVEAEALEGDLVKALRLCLKLGGVTGSEDLREWASLELLGYRGEEELPDYRKVHAPLLIDGINGNWKFTGQSISYLQLPEFAQETITDEVLLPHGAPQLVELEKDAQSGEPVRLGPPGSQEVVTYMNMTSTEPFQQINRMYWGISRSVLQGLIEDIRSRLVALVAEMKAGLEPGEQIPSAAVASQALNVVVQGDHARVKAKHSGKVTVTPGDHKGVVRKSLEVGAWLAGIAAVVILVLLNWETITGWF